MSKIKSLHVKGCYKTISIHVTPKGWRHCVQPRGLTSNVEIPSLSQWLRHPLAVFITGTSRQKKKKSRSSQNGLFYGLLLKLLHVHFFFLVQCAAIGPKGLFPFKQSIKFFWVFPLVSPSRNWIMYLQSELLCARLAVMWPVCPITRPWEFCHLSWTDFWCCLSTLRDQGLRVEKCRTTYSKSTNYEQASDHRSEIIFRPSFWAPEKEVWRL